MADENYDGEFDGDEGFEVDLDDIPDDVEIPAGTYELTVTGAKNFGRVFEFTFEIKSGDYAGALCRDRLNLDVPFNRERLKRFGEAVGVKRNERGKWDFSEGALVGREFMAYVKRSAFLDANTPSRYIKRKAEVEVPKDLL